MKPSLLILVLVICPLSLAMAADAEKVTQPAEIQRQLDQLKIAKQQELNRFNRAQWLIDLEKVKDEAVANIRILEQRERELQEKLKAEGTKAEK